MHISKARSATTVKRSLAKRSLVSTLQDPTIIDDIISSKQIRLFSGKLLDPVVIDNLINAAQTRSFTKSVNDTTIIDRLASKGIMNANDPTIIDSPLIPCAILSDPTIIAS